MSESGAERSSLRLVGIVLLVLLLGATVAGANAAVAAERTVLSAEFVKTTLEEEDAYDPLQSAVVDAAEDELALNGTMGELPIDSGNLVEEAVPPAYVEGQVETNVDRIYAYLDGERETLEVAVNLTPVKGNVADFVEGQIRNTSTEELFLAVAGESTTFEVQGVTVNLADIAGMAGSESAYEEARTEFRADVRQVVVNRAVNRTFREASNDQLLALVIEDYDPRNYTAAQKEQLVEDREPEIKSALETRLEENTDLNATVDRQLNATRDELKAQVRSTVTEQAGAIDPALAEPSADLAALWVDGLAGDMAYETFAERVEENKSALAAAVGDVVEQRLDEAAPDRLELTEEMDPSTRERLETVRQAVGIVGVLVYLLPVLALVLVGAIWFVSRSPAITAAGAGVGGIIGGLPLYAVAGIIPPRVQSQLQGEAPPSVVDVVVGFVEQGAAVLATQSLVLVIVGALLVVAGVGYHLYGDRLRE